MNYGFLFPYHDFQILFNTASQEDPTNQLKLTEKT